MAGLVSHYSIAQLVVQLSLKECVSGSSPDATNMTGYHLLFPLARNIFLLLLSSPRFRISPVSWSHENKKQVRTVPCLCDWPRVLVGVDAAGRDIQLAGNPRSCAVNSLWRVCIWLGVLSVPEWSYPRGCVYWSQTNCCHGSPHGFDTILPVAACAESVWCVRQEGWQAIWCSPSEMTRLAKTLPANCDMPCCKCGSNHDDRRLESQGKS